MRAVLFGGTVPPLHAKTGEFLATDPYARARVAQAEARLGTGLLERFAGAAESYSSIARQAYLITCVALADRHEEEDGPPGLCVAASLGHLPALHRVGALSFEEMLRLGDEIAVRENEWTARERGYSAHFMYRVDRDRLAELRSLVEADGGWTEVAGRFNDQIHLLNVTAEHLPLLEREVRAGGGVPVLSFGQAEHSSVNAPLRDRLADEVMAAAEVRDARTGMVSGATGEVLHDRESLRALLVRDCVTPVDFPLVVATLQAAGVDRVCVVGPGNLFERLTREHFDVVVIAPDGRARGLAGTGAPRVVSSPQGGGPGPGSRNGVGP